ncbi:hypothetical protein B7P34_29810 [Streptosporangium nondiastaticum]|uniref:Uncharacterized protein n=1 Tax=Streptosporangium nondiastaticum TaxID=35764 RepID=A0A9X7PES0_9ACTN|nr:hypothetical protein [Streptosporangium nondiastaticum]PSJ25121.1 hypothetical protein B7P34_29810 [Streptosporangium nondiastaticum]
MGDWDWKYDPDARHVIGETPNLAFVAQVEERADELVRAAAALYPDGASYQGRSPGVQDEVLPGGMFQYLTVVRQQCLYIVQVTAWPL